MVRGLFSRFRSPSVQGFGSFVSTSKRELMREKREVAGSFHGTSRLHESGKNVKGGYI